MPEKEIEHTGESVIVIYYTAHPRVIFKQILHWYKYEFLLDTQFSSYSSLNVKRSSETQIFNY